MKLGEQTVVLDAVVDDWINTDAYGNPAKVHTYTELRWCLFTPTRSSEDQTRTSPAISGGTLLAPPGTGAQIEQADAILTHWKHDPAAVPPYTGRRWQVAGEVGEWEGEAVEVQLRRLT